MLMTDPAFAPVREEAYHAKLPEDGAERWRAFWREVRELWEWDRP